MGKHRRKPVASEPEAPSSSPPPTAPSVCNKRSPHHTALLPLKSVKPRCGATSPAMDTGNGSGVISLESGNGSDFGPDCPNGGMDPYTPVLVSLQLMIAVMAILGNSVVIWLIYKHSALHTANNLFVVALAVADLLVGFNIPFYITFYFDVSYKCDRTVCIVRYALALFVTLLSVLLLIGVAVDRYLSVVFALKYHNIMRFRLAKRIICLVYVYVVIIVVLPIFFSIKWNQPRECDLVYVLTFDYTFFVVLSHVALTILVTLLLYMKIFREAWHHLHVSNTPRDAQVHQEAKIARMMVVILGVHMVSLIPYLVVVVLGYMATGERATGAISDAKKFIVVLYFGKSALNPVIYGWKNHDLRLAFLRVLGRENSECAATANAVVNATVNPAALHSLFLLRPTPTVASCKGGLGGRWPKGRTRRQERQQTVEINVGELKRFRQNSDLF